MTAAGADIQCADALFVVRPAAFGFNAETAGSNAFQHAAEQGGETGVAPAEAIARLAQRESDALVDALRAAGVTVCVGLDRAPPVRPDAVFPNNWVSLHRDGRIVLYPMCAPNRRLERRTEYLAQIALELGFKERERIDLAFHEDEVRFLEGTGSLVLDHVLRRAYACRSVRSDADLVREWCERMGYEPVLFDATDGFGRAYYHTNVVLSIGSRAVIAALDGVPAPQAAALRERLRDGARVLVEIDAGDVAAFAGNLLEVTARGADGHARQLWVMSEGARAALGAERLARLTAGGEQILSVAIPTIERIGGGSVRCMLAEVPRGAGA